LVAIGATTTPYAKLSILAGSAGTTTLALVPGLSGTANILDIYTTGGLLGSVFTANHFLGIGSTSPSQALSVLGGAYFTGNIQNVANITATGTLTVSGGTSLQGAT